MSVLNVACSSSRTLFPQNGSEVFVRFVKISCIRSLVLSVTVLLFGAKEFHNYKKLDQKTRSDAFLSDTQIKLFMCKSRWRSG